MAAGAWRDCGIIEQPCLSGPLGRLGGPSALHSLRAVGLRTGATLRVPVGLTDAAFLARRAGSCAVNHLKRSLITTHRSHRLHCAQARLLQLTGK